MKVLQINSVCGIGSTGRIVTDINDILIEKGHESYIAYGRNMPKNCSDAIKIGTNIDNYIHVAKTKILDKHGFGSKKSTKDFVNKIIELDPDVIHLHNIHGYYLNIEVLFNYLKKANKPVIWTLHDCWSFTGHCAYFDYAGCDKWKTGCYNCPEKKSYPSSMILDNSKTNYASKKEIFTGVKNLTIVTPSQWLANLVKISYLRDYSVEVINNGIDLNIFKPTKNKFKEKYNLQDKFIILGVASIWDRRKGLKYFIEMSSELKEDEVIVIVGLSEKQLKEIPDNIIGISRTNNAKELADIYSSSDIFVNPTLEDNFPTTNLEALACAKFVITFDTGGSIESIDQNTGSIIYTRDSNVIYKEIQKYREKKSDEGHRCVSRANSLYNKNDRYKDYIDLYKSVNLIKETYHEC